MRDDHYDELLNIKTTEHQKGFHPSFHYHRYEPTPYQALDKLFQHYELKSSDYVVDFGCGKGRLNFYLHYHFRLNVTGVEMNEVFYKEAKGNQEHYEQKHKFNKENIQFLCCLAEEYEIHPKDNRFYFFNPFTVIIFRNVVNNILSSVEQNYREVEIILYYPPEDYLYYLENHPSFELKEEVKLQQYQHNINERFLIWGLTPAAVEC